MNSATLLWDLARVLALDTAPYLLVLLLANLVALFAHELGHFAVARSVGLPVEEFSIGLGKRLVSVTDRRGTRWTLAAFPVGGYLKVRISPDDWPETARLPHLNSA